MLCIYKCTSCAWEFQTWGPREFFVNAAGERESYGHPLPCSDEARQAGVFGLDARRYCVECGAVSGVVLEEFDPPLHDPFKVWDDGANRSERRSLDPECGACGSRNLVAALPEDVETPCRKCGAGQLVLSGGGVS